MESTKQMFSNSIEGIHESTKKDIYSVKPISSKILAAFSMSVFDILRTCASVNST